MMFSCRFGCCDDSSSLPQDTALQLSMPSYSFDCQLVPELLLHDITVSRENSDSTKLEGSKDSVCSKWSSRL